MAEESKRIRVIIIDDIGETRENLRKLLSFEPDLEVVGAAAGGAQGIELAEELAPDVVLMDVNMPEMDGITATEKLLQEVPATQVVMLSVHGESDYLRRAMLVGARDYITKPASGDELVNTIHRVFEMGKVQAVSRKASRGDLALGRADDEERPGRAGQLVAIVAPKGGTGGTTVAVNTAVGLRQALAPDREVALVDGNLQLGDVGVMLNLRPHRSIADLTERIDQLDGDLLQSVMTAHPSGIKVLLAPPRPEAAESLLGTPNGQEGGSPMAAILSTLRLGFDVIVVDVWSWIDDIALTLLDAAQLIAVVVTPDIPAVKSARLFLELADKLDYPEEKLMLIVNRADREDGLHTTRIEKALMPVAAEIPCDERAALAAADRGEPLVMRDRERPISRSLLELAELIQTRLSEMEKDGSETEPGAKAGEPARAGLLGLRRVFGRG